MAFRIGIPSDEWRGALAVCRALSDDERSARGWVALIGEEDQRIWQAVGNHMAVRWTVSAPRSSDRFRLLVPPSIIMFGAVAAGDDEMAHLSVPAVPQGDFPALEVSGPGGSLIVDLDHGASEMVDTEAAMATGDLTAWAVVSAGGLLSMVRARTARVVARDDELDEEPAYLFGIEDGRLHASVSWAVCGVTEYSVGALDYDGVGYVIVDPNMLASGLELFDEGETVTVSIPRLVSRPVSIVGRDLEVALRPAVTWQERLRARVLDIIREVGGPLAVERDAEGDHLLSRSALPIYGRLRLDADPPLFQVFAVLVEDVEVTAGLLVELNDLNAQIGIARVFQANGRVLGQVDLVATTLDGTELGSAIDRLTTIAERISPMVAAVHGGEPPADPFERRWSLYRDTIVSAEATPGVVEDLNGPAAVDAWPFPSAVHVLTAWNPQGVPMGESRHREVQLRLVEEVLRRGGRFVHGTGRAIEGGHAEPSIIVWGLDRSIAMAIGRQASQDAIFEIDADQIRMVSCVDDRVETWPRRGSSTT